MTSCIICKTNGFPDGCPIATPYGVCFHPNQMLHLWIFKFLKSMPLHRSDMQGQHIEILKSTHIY